MRGEYLTGLTRHRKGLLGNMILQVRVGYTHTMGGVDFVSYLWRDADKHDVKILRSIGFDV